MEDSLAIRVQGLTKVYGDLRAVNGIDLAVPEGRVFALLGPNGAGKTTTVEILEGLRTLTSGSAYVLGHDVTRAYDAIRAEVGILPQDFQPFDRLTAREHLRYFAALFGKRLDKAGIDRILDMVRLSDRADEQARKLSGGEKRKLGIALSLVGDPRLTFLDEPTTGLDPSARRDLWRIVRGLREGGRTVVLTTHYIEEAEALADDVAILLNGEIVASGSPRELVDAHGGGRTIRLVGAGSAGLAALARADLDIEVDGEDLIVRSALSDGLGQVFSVLATKGVSFRDVRTSRPHLEEVFLKLVGARLEEGELHP
ncbi:MAG: ABC transporter ATP-binding protein [Thermoplasmata archaeon]